MIDLRPSLASTFCVHLCQFGQFGGPEMELRLVARVSICTTKVSVCLLARVSKPCGSLVWLSLSRVAGLRVGRAASERRHSRPTTFGGCLLAERLGQETGWTNKTPLASIITLFQRATRRFFRPAADEQSSSKGQHSVSRCSHLPETVCAPACSPQTVLGEQ